jgi:hypothetical protein
MKRYTSVEHFVLDFYGPELKLAVEIDGDSHYIPPLPLLIKEGIKWWLFLVKVNPLLRGV